jgi:hypothetical protein
MSVGGQRNVHIGVTERLGHRHDIGSGRRLGRGMIRALGTAAAGLPARAPFYRFG